MTDSIISREALQRTIMKAVAKYTPTKVLREMNREWNDDIKKLNEHVDSYIAQTLKEAIPDKKDFRSTALTSNMDNDVLKHRIGFEDGWNAAIDALTASLEKGQE